MDEENFERRRREDEVGRRTEMKKREGESQIFAGGSKNIENAPLFSGSARVYARNGKAREREREKRTEERRARGRWEGNGERKSTRGRKAAVEARARSARTAGADRVYARYDWLDESIVDPLSRSRRGGGTAPTSLTYTTGVV